MKKVSIKGFTLVEVIVVIGIMAILTTIAYASLSQIRAKSRDQKRVANLHEIQLALEYYFNKNGQYPEMIWPTDVNYPDNYKSLYGYLGEEPKDPTPGKIYHYVPFKLNPTSASRCISYHLWTELELRSAALESRRAFNATGQNKCVATNPETLINASDPVNSKVYDLRP